MAVATFASPSWRATPIVHAPGDAVLQGRAEATSPSGPGPRPGRSLTCSSNLDARDLGSAGRLAAVADFGERHDPLFDRAHPNDPNHRLVKHLRQSAMPCSGSSPPTASLDERRGEQGIQARRHQRSSIEGGSEPTLCRTDPWGVMTFQVGPANRAAKLGANKPEAEGRSSRQ